ncbi:aminopeptidase P family protein [Serratia marcescens]|uniref:aminopeptidase P family protein n=1 Tax=Serratia marcescens TaxID=615 RepID=UPI0039B5EF53
MSVFKERVYLMREYLYLNHIDAILIPCNDMHHLDECHDCDKKLEYISGFTGSAGYALITKGSAFLFVDGRYGIQGKKQVDRDIYSVVDIESQSLIVWISENFNEGMTLGFESILMPCNMYDELNRLNIKLQPLSNDPFDVIWKERPERYVGRIEVLPKELSGECSRDKVKRIVTWMKSNNINYIFIFSPDNVAWLLNVRGSDIPMTQVPLSFAILKDDGALTWFVDKNKIVNIGFDYLKHVEIANYSDTYKVLGRILSESRVLLDPEITPISVRLYLERNKVTCVMRTDPVALFKINKNPVELVGYRTSHISDAIAWVNFLYWLCNEIGIGKENEARITEVDAGNMLEFFKCKFDSYLEPSFKTISASGANSSQCHYSASASTNRILCKDNFYLIDSGSQYISGTTDVTRTLSFSELKKQMRIDYTAVLKGFISIMTTQFPSGTKGYQLDAFSRKTLWELGKDFSHSTGHGVGHRLLVHEKPLRISKGIDTEGLKVGNVLTIEPGYYLEDEYGIRIENQVEVVEGDYIGFCKFKSLTLIPIDLSPVEVSMLTLSDVEFINDYHEQVRDTIYPFCSHDVREWLVSATKPI